MFYLSLKTAQIETPFTLVSNTDNIQRCMFHYYRCYFNNDGN